MAQSTYDNVPSTPPDPASSPSLESLPAELKDQILLSVPDLPTLYALVHASPVMHAQYLSNRDSVLRACVERELDGFLVHAYACLKSRVHCLGRIRTDEAITSFLDAYRGWLPSGSSPCTDLDSVEPSLVRWIAGFHLSVARPLARIYGTWALANLVQEAALPSAEQQVPETAAAGGQEATLSRSEEIRIMRALYQCETYHHLFGRNRGNRRGAFRHHEINGIFFSLFDPWEAEAVGCIDIFIRQKYEVIFDKVLADLHYTNPRFKQLNGVTNPTGSFDLDREREDYMEGTVSRGLRTTARLLTINDHDALVREMELRLAHEHNLDWSLRHALGMEAQDDRRGMLGVNARDEAETRRDSIEFAGDAVPPDGPPLGWVLLWAGIYSNICGEYVPPPVRQWGYVMWDERRWTELGAKDLVPRQWETAQDLIESIERDYGWRPSGW